MAADRGTGVMRITAGAVATSPVEGGTSGGAPGHAGATPGGAPGRASGGSAGPFAGQGGPPLGARLSTAALLIGKAQGSAYSAEQESLALRAYRELAAYLNSVQPPDVGGRRRERRLLTDRRSGKRRTDPQPPVIDLRLDQARAAYRAAAPEPGSVGSHLDLGL